MIWRAIIFWLLGVSLAFADFPRHFKALATIHVQYYGNRNLINDGTRSFYFDAENQLTNVSVVGQWQVSFVYDGLNRRRITQEFTWQSGGWLKTNEIHYLCDGPLVIQERDTNNNPQVTYTRGLDLSLTLQGAGGIGGLLGRTDSNGSTFYHADGNGNITALLDGYQNIVARYRYDAFGKLLGEWGTNADLNHYRFSSMEFFSNPGISGYPRRFYEPNFQRWLNRDPIGETGGINLYGSVGNNPVNFVDPYGLDPWYSWLNPFSYSSGYARSQGVQALNAQLAANDYSGVGDFQQANPTWNGNGNLTAGNMQAVQASANLAADAANGYLNTMQAIVPAGVVSKAEQAAAQAIADANQGGLLSKLLSKCKSNKTPHFHHPWPKYLGGNPEQILEPLPKALHDAYHAGLDQILPRQPGADFYSDLPPDAQAQVLQALNTYTQAFDAQYGTQLYNAMVREGFPY
jgi:RHS repeat-associated protein